MKSLAVFIVMALAAAGLWGQSNEMLDSFLEAEKADVAMSMLFVAQVTGELPLEATPAEGFFWGSAQEFGRHVTAKSPTDPIGLGLFYLVLLKTFDVKGGFMFNVFGTPRYAAHEAAYFGYVDPSRLYHTRFLLPYEVLTGITYVQESKEAQRKKEEAEMKRTGQKKEKTAR